jgi:hypothetical protein
MRILSIITISYTDISSRSAKSIPEKAQQNQRPHYGEAFFLWKHVEARFTQNYNSQPILFGIKYLEGYVFS